MVRHYKEDGVKLRTCGTATNLHKLELWHFGSAVLQSVFNGSAHIESDAANQREKEKRFIRWWTE
jgi:hypothetical protein